MQLPEPVYRNSQQQVCYDEQAKLLYIYHRLVCKTSVQNSAGVYKYSISICRQSTQCSLPAVNGRRPNDTLTSAVKWVGDVLEYSVIQYDSKRFSIALLALTTSMYNSSYRKNSVYIQKQTTIAETNSQQSLQLHAYANMWKKLKHVVMCVSVERQQTFCPLIPSPPLDGSPFCPFLPAKPESPSGPWGPGRPEKPGSPCSVITVKLQNELPYETSDKRSYFVSIMLCFYTVKKKFFKCFAVVK